MTFQDRMLIYQTKTQLNNTKNDETPRMMKDGEEQQKDRSANKE
jgi:hypothetical protein